MESERKKNNWVLLLMMVCAEENLFSRHRPRTNSKSQIVAQRGVDVWNWYTILWHFVDVSMAVV